MTFATRTALRLIVTSVTGGLVGTLATMFVLAVAWQESIQWEEREPEHIVAHIRNEFAFLMMVSVPIILICLLLLSFLLRRTIFQWSALKAGVFGALAGLMVLVMLVGLLLPLTAISHPLETAVVGAVYGGAVGLVWGLQSKERHLG